MTMRTLRVMPENFNHLTGYSAPCPGRSVVDATRTLVKVPRAGCQSLQRTAPSTQTALGRHAGDARHAVLFCLLLKLLNAPKETA